MSTRPGTRRRAAAAQGSSAASNGRLDSPELVRSGLEAVQTNIFIADPKFKIIFANARALETLRGIEGELRKAFGVGAVGVSGPHSAEAWKGYKYPDKFDGVLPALWQSDGVTLYRVPLTNPSRLTSLTVGIAP